MKYFLHNIFLSLSSVREVRVGRGLFFLGFFSALVSCASRELEEPPIITSATYQHTLYNGRPQPIEVSAAKEGAPFIVTYFTSEENLEQDKGGTETPPTQAGVYYARVRR
ncbi:MAG: hypothetical protein LBK13_10765, partial [Spirochaetales bacterium]|nr:hypothetical protein [Spirochaetales bacterium]